EEAVRSTPCFSRAWSTAFCRTSSSVSPVTSARQTTPASAHLKLFVNLTSCPGSADLGSTLGAICTIHRARAPDEERQAGDGGDAQDPEGPSRGGCLRGGGAAWDRRSGRVRRRSAHRGPCVLASRDELRRLLDLRHRRNRSLG